VAAAAAAAGSGRGSGEQLRGASLAAPRHAPQQLAADEAAAGVNVGELRPDGSARGVAAQNAGSARKSRSRMAGPTYHNRLTVRMDGGRTEWRVHKTKFARQYIGARKLFSGTQVNIIFRNDIQIKNSFFVGLAGPWARPWPVQSGLGSLFLKRRTRLLVLFSLLIHMSVRAYCRPLQKKKKPLQHTIKCYGRRQLILH
jgi:hypothetical protein